MTLHAADLFSTHTGRVDPVRPASIDILKLSTSFAIVGLFCYTRKPETKDKSPAADSMEASMRSFSPTSSSMPGLVSLRITIRVLALLWPVVG
jgi:hypothetical protein